MHFQFKILENGRKKMFTENQTTNKIAQPFFYVKAVIQR